MMNSKHVEVSGHGLIEGNIPAFAEGTEKNTKNISKDSRSPGRYLNRGPPEQKAGVYQCIRKFISNCGRLRSLIKVRFRVILVA
jgi:hypothetical protein